MQQKTINSKTTAIRTDYHTCQEREAEIVWEISPYTSKNAKPGELLFSIIKGGVTGFEQFPFMIDDIERLCKDGWAVCGGDIGLFYPKYDRLVIREKELKKIFKQLE